MGFSITTFVFEVVNFLVLVAILRWILYAPLKRAIAERRKGLEDREAQAAEKISVAERREREAAAQAAGLDELRAETLRKATEQAAAERASLIEQAREDAAAERTRAQRLLEIEREAAHAWVREMAIEQGADIAGRMLLSLAPHAVEDALFDLLLHELLRRGDELAAAAGRDASPEVEVRFASVPSDDRIARLRERLSAVLGASPRLVLRDDTTLRAGLAVRVGHVVLDASVGGQLQALRSRARELLTAEVPLG